MARDAAGQKKNYAALTIEGNGSALLDSGKEELRSSLATRRMLLCVTRMSP